MATHTVLSSNQLNRVMRIAEDAESEEHAIKMLQMGRAIEQAVLQSPEVRRLREDAGRYRVLRDDDYQMLEDDPCVTDDSFNTFFGDELDKAIDALKSRRDAAMEKQP